MSISLLNKIPLTISRFTSEGYYQGGEWVAGTTDTLDIRCSIQPHRSGDTQSVLPEGVIASDAVFVYTKTELKTVNQFDFTEADVTVLDGREYVAFNVENWNRNPGLVPNHFKVIFIRKDKFPAGKL